MSAKREQARKAAAEARARAEAKDVMAGLRELGFRAEEARGATAFSESLQDATVEDRMRAALAFLKPKACVRAAPE